MSTHADVLVYGAAGHTGRFVMSELARRGYSAVAAGRDREKLSDMYPGQRIAVAAVTNDEHLDKALSGVAALINCAGPFYDTALPLLAAAKRSGTMHLDVAPEQAVVQTMFDQQDRPAFDDDITVVPAAAFYGGLADLLASALIQDQPGADIDIHVGLDSWHPTSGTRETGRRNTAPRVVVDGGRIIAMPQPAQHKQWSFEGGFGEREMVMQPFSEIITIHSHLKPQRVTPWINLAPLRDLRESSTPPPLGIDGYGRSAQQFVMDVTAKVGGRVVRATATGRDIYFITAPLIVEAMERLLDGKTIRNPSGIHAMGALFGARDFQDAIDLEFLRVTYSEGT